MPAPKFHTLKIEYELLQKLDKFILRNKKKGITTRTEAITYFMEGYLNNDSIDDYVLIKNKYNSLVEEIRNIKNIKTAKEGEEWGNRVEEIIKSD
jgi:hypothetical protein